MRRTTFAIALLCLVSQGFAQSSKCACCDPVHREFIFWAGSWKVFTPDGKLAGENTISIAQDSCVLQENWVSASPGYRGTSYNFFDRQSGTWKQVWIDNQGASLELEGGYVNGSMVLASKEKVNQKGDRVTDRITWTPANNGTLRQHWEQSVDGGKTWTTLFDGAYRKK